MEICFSMLGSNTRDGEKKTGIRGTEWFGGWYKNKTSSISFGSKLLNGL